MEPASLSPRAELVILMRQVGLPFREIGRRVGVSCSRASQLHAMAIKDGERLFSEGVPEAVTPEMVTLFIVGATEGLRTLREAASGTT